MRSLPRNSSRSSRSSHTYALAACVLGCTLASPSLAEAQVSARNKAKAKTLYQQGAQAIFSGKYGEAIFHLKAGQRLDPNGMFPYTIAIAYGRLGKFDEAITSARQALTYDDLPASTRTKNLARLRAYERAVNARVASSGVRAAREAATARQASKVKTDPLVTTPVVPPKRGFGGLGWTGVGATVVGAGLLGGALYTNTQVNARLEDDGETVKPTSSREEVEGLQQRGLILLGAGGVLVTTGVILMLVDATSGSNATTGQRIVPTLQPHADGASAGVYVRF